jgi:hypothetical protein
VNHDRTRTSGGEPAGLPEVARQFIEALTVTGGTGERCVLGSSGKLGIGFEPTRVAEERSR